MRILMRILGIIAVIVAVGMGTLGVVRSFGDAKDAKEAAPMIEQAKKELETMKENVKQLSGLEADAMNSEIADMEEMMDIASPGTYTTIGILFVILALTSLISAVFLFKAGGKTALMVLGATVAVSLIAIVLSPDFSSKYGAMSNRTIAIIVAVPAILAALFAFAMRNGKKQPAQA